MYKYVLLFFLILLPACTNAPAAIQPETVNARADTQKAGLYMHACALFNAGKYTEATDAFKFLISTYPGYYPAYGKLIVVCRKNGTLADCRNYFEALLAANPDPGRNYIYYYALGAGAAAALQWDEAVFHYGKAIEAAPDFYPAYMKLADAFLENTADKDNAAKAEAVLKQYQDKPANAIYAAFGLGYLYSNIYRFDEAYELLNQAAESVVDWGGALYHHLGRIYYNTGRMEKAIVALEKAYSLYQGKDDPENAGNVLQVMALAYSGLGNFQKSLEINNQALVLARELGNTSSEARILNGIGIIHYNSGEYAKAITHYKDSLALSQEAGDKKAENAAYLNIGIVYQASGDYLNALECFETGLKIAQELNLKTNIVKIYGNLAVLYVYIGNTSLRMEYLLKALQLNREIGNREDEAIIQNNLCDIYIEQKDYEKAISAAGDALNIARELNLAINECYSLLKLGTAYLELEKYKAAAEYLQESLGKARILELKVVENYLLILMARLYSEEGDYEKSRALYLSAIALSGQTETSNFIFEAQDGLGRLFRKTGAYKNALEYYREAIKNVESLRTGIKDESFKTAFMENKILIYENTVSVLYEMYTRDKTIDSAREAFTCAEQARARSFSDMLLEGNLKIKQAVDPSPLSITQDNPGYADSIYPGPVALKDLQEQLLDEATVLLEYMVTDDKLFLWRITNNEFTLFPLEIPREELRLEIEKIRNFITAGLDLSLFPALASGLYAKILEPALKEILPGKRLLISGNDVLNYLPFELLMQQKAGYIINQYPVYYIPSATVLGTLVHRQNGQQTGDKLLAIGDPVIESANAGNTAHLRGVLDYTDFSRLQPLPGTGNELDGIAALFSRKDVYTRENAVKGIIKIPGLLKQYKYIHFATHAFINQEKPQFSGLLLSRGDEPSDDGFLTMQEILDLELDADLVVLSACSTGIGQEVRGEGLISLARAFFSAGAASVVASLWRVDDKATALLMTEFYKNLANGRKKAEALQHAKLWLMQQDKKYEHPYYWAGFILMGVDL